MEGVNMKKSWLGLLAALLSFALLATGALAEFDDVSGDFEPEVEEVDEFLFSGEDTGEAELEYEEETDIAAVNTDCFYEEGESEEAYTGWLDESEVPFDEVPMATINGISFPYPDNYSSSYGTISGRYIQKDDIGSGCYRFAYLVYGDVFHRNMAEDRYNSSCTVTPYKQVIPTTADNLKKYILMSGQGAVMRVTSNSSYSPYDNSGHSIIIIDADSNGAWLYQAQGNGLIMSNNTVNYYSWNDIAKRCFTTSPGFTSSGQYIKYIICPPGYRNFDGNVQPEPTNYTEYKVVTSDGLNMRASASTSGTYITTLWPGDTVKVTQKTSADGYTWGYGTSSNGYTGWIVVDNHWTEVVNSTIHTHSPQTVSGYAATCTATGLTDGIKCSVCGEWITPQETIPAKGHTAQTVKGKAATCTATGLSDGSKCSVCGEWITMQTTIPAKGHTAQTVKGKAATCTATGLSDGSKCSVCGTWITRQTTIPAKGHKSVSDIYGTHCSVCGTTLSQATGWRQSGNRWYYIATPGKFLTGWQKIGSKWYCFSEGGVMLTGWQKIGGKWYCFNPGGSMKTGWQKMGGKWYCFNPGGSMKTGWQKIGGKWYYFKPGDSGAMLTGWQKIGGKWYYFKPGDSGAMLTGWQKIGNKYYYFTPGDGGAMKTGWQTIGGKKYYFLPGGAMVTGWQNIGGKQYYFLPGGSMVTGRQKISGRWYRFNSNGVLIG